METVATMKRKRIYKNRGPETRNWCFTINNYTQADTPNTDDYDYLICGKEIGLDGTDHIQGFFRLPKKKRLPAVKKLMPRAHLEPKRGTYKQAIDYCKKDGVFQEWGTEPIDPASKKNCDWDAYYDACVENRPDDIPKSVRFRHYHKVQRIIQDNPVKPPDLKERHNYWVYAPTDFGKSTYVRMRWPCLYDKGPNKWWIGYKGQENVLLDDFSPKQCYHLGWYFKRWCDKFSFPMETKGGGRQIRPKRIIVTSQHTIEECFGYDDLVMAAIKNRFQVIELLHWKERISFSQVM